MRPVQKTPSVSQLGCSACGGALLAVAWLLPAPARSAGMSGWEAGAVVSCGASGSESVSARSADGAQRKQFPALQSKRTSQAEHRQYQKGKERGLWLTIAQLLVFGSIVL